MGKVHQDQINYHKKVHKESEDRLKTANEKIISQGGELKQKAIELEKMKKSNDSLDKQNKQLKEKINSLEKKIKAKETEIS